MQHQTLNRDEDFLMLVSTMPERVGQKLGFVISYLRGLLVVKIRTARGKSDSDGVRRDANHSILKRGKFVIHHMVPAFSLLVGLRLRT